MKRHKSLHGLSSEHHHGLVWARQLGRAAKSGDPDKITGITEQFLHFWQEHLTEHFRKEEDILFPVYHACYGEATPLVMETLRQHVTIRSAVFRLKKSLEAGNVQSNQLEELSVFLNDHVRLEERELFEEIQKNCSEEYLKELEEFPELQKKP